MCTRNALPISIRPVHFQSGFDLPLFHVRPAGPSSIYSSACHALHASLISANTLRFMKLHSGLKPASLHPVCHIPPPPPPPPPSRPLIRTAHPLNTCPVAFIGLSARHASCRTESVSTPQREQIYVSTHSARGQALIQGREGGSGGGGSGAHKCNGALGKETGWMKGEERNKVGG